MSHKLLIENVGPLNKIDFEINKINVFIGPQSSGKSTVAKILSFCFWLEKNIIECQSKNHVNTDFLQKELIDYHKLASYFSENSHIEYISDVISFDFRDLTHFNIKCNDKQAVGKVAYIPAERNVLGIANISSLSLADDYVRSFIFDWLSIRGKFDLTNELPILDLNVNYYYDVNRGDVLRLSNGKEITLSQASSGLQSLIPLIVYNKYVTEWIYTHDADISFSKYSVLLNTVKSILKSQKNDGISKPTTEQVNMLIQMMYKKMSEHSAQDTEGQKFISMVDRIAKPHYSTLVIEEPELNIYPSTQYELVKHIISSIDISRGDRLVITTHSPYVLSSLNNIIQAGKINHKYRKAVKKILRTDAVIAFDDINAIFVHDGLSDVIRDDDYSMISFEALDKASDIIGTDFDRLLDLEQK